MSAERSPLSRSTPRTTTRAAGSDASSPYAPRSMPVNDLPISHRSLDLWDYPNQDGQWTAYELTGSTISDVRPSWRCMVPGCSQYDKLWHRRDSFRTHVHLTHPDFEFHDLEKLGQEDSRLAERDEEKDNRNPRHNNDQLAKNMTRDNHTHGTSTLPSRPSRGQLRLKEHRLATFDQLLPTGWTEPGTSGHTGHIDNSSVYVFPGLGLDDPRSSIIEGATMYMASYKTWLHESRKLQIWDLAKTRRHSVSWFDHSSFMPLIRDEHFGLARSHISYEALCNTWNEQNLEAMWKTLLKCTDDAQRCRLMNTCWRQWAQVVATLGTSRALHCKDVIDRKEGKGDPQTPDKVTMMCQQVNPDDASTIPTLGISLESGATLFPGDPKTDVLRDTSPSDDSLPTTRSDVSSPDWIDDEKDWQALQLVYTSSAALLSAYGKYSAHGRSGQDSKAGQPTKATGCSRPSSQGQTSSQEDSCSRKRKFGRMDRNHKEEEGDDSDDRRRHPTSNKSSRPDKSSEPTLACPFNKYNSKLFGPGSPDESYHGCASCSFVNIGYLKQHLQRSHYVPKHYCFRCYTKFSSQGAVATHMRNDPPCSRKDPPLYRERISIDLAEQLGLERKNPQGTDKRIYWHRLYEAFFPGAASIRNVSPFYEGPAAQQLNEFLSFSRSNISDLVVRVKQRLRNNLNTITPADQGQLVDEIVQVAGQQYMENLAVHTFPQLGQRSVDPRIQVLLSADAASVTTMPAGARADDRIQDVSSTSATCQDSEPGSNTTCITSLPSEFPQCQYSDGPRENLSKVPNPPPAENRPDITVENFLMMEDGLDFKPTNAEPPWALSALSFVTGNEEKENIAAVREPVITGVIDLDWGPELDNMEGFDWVVFQAPYTDYLQPEYLR